MKQLALFVLLLATLVLPVRAQEKIELGKDVEVSPLAPGIWRHVTYQVMEEKWRMPANRLIVPGHGDPGGWELVANTLKLLKENRK